MKSVPWSLAARLLARDWRSGETLVLLAALVVAVAAMSAVTFFTDRVRQAVGQQAGASLAADLRLESGDPLPQEYFKAASGFGLATAKIVQFRSVVLAGESSTLAEVRGVSAGYPLRGEVKIADRLAGQPYSATGIPPAGQAWAEPSLLARLGAQVGDALSVGKLRLAAAHTLEYRPDEGWRLMELAPTVLLNLDDVYASGLLQPGSIARYVGLFAGAPAALARYRQWLSPRLGAGQRLEDLHDVGPEVMRSVSRAERFLVLAALVSVLLGGVAVAMAARRFVVRRLDAVALMKCLGARHRDVLRLSITQLAILIAAAAVIGSVIGLTAQFGLTLILADFIEAPLPLPSASGALLGPVTALAVAIGFALPPLLQLGGVPPARVLRRDLEPPPLRYAAIYGAATLAVAGMLYLLFGDFALLGYLLAGSFVTLALLYAAGRLLVLALQRVRGRVGVAWRYGIANVARRGRESSVQVVAFGIGLMVLLLLTVVRGQLMADWQATLPKSAPNRFALNIQPDERAEVRDVLAKDALPAPEFTPLVRARISAVNGRPLAKYHAKDGRAGHELNEELNLTWAAAPAPGNRVVAGQWWQPGDTEPQLSIEQERLDELGLALGDTLTFSIGGESLTFRISNARSIQWDTFRPNFFMVASPGAVERFAHTFITSFYVPPEARRVTVDLARALPSVSVIDIDELLAQVRSAMNRAALAVQYVFLFTLAAGIVVLLAAIQSTRDERMFESAVLRTLCARRSTVLQGVASEFTALGLLAGLLAACGAGGIGYVIASRLFDLDYLPGPGLWLAGLAAGAAIVGISGTLAVRSVVNESPVATLRGA
ncbi:MAG TPA: FtsX-like permease family protein [Gammaproteobacteria bacterium]|nr:FtsX-like permease family protein [Gammaproteobacteria bacterium]